MTTPQTLGELEAWLEKRHEHGDYIDPGAFLVQILQPILHGDAPCEDCGGSGQCGHQDWHAWTCVPGCPATCPSCNNGRVGGLVDRVEPKYPPTEMVGLTLEQLTNDWAAALTSELNTKEEADV